MTTRRCGPAVATVVAAAVALGCSKSDDPPNIQVYGRDIVAGCANVTVLRDGVGVDGAVVRVNGEVVPRNASEPGFYSGTYAIPTHGDAVVLEVASGDSTVRATATLPETPVLTSPANGTAFLPGDDVVVSWTSASDPGYFQVTALWSCGPDCGAGLPFEAAGSARTLTIPAGALSQIPAGTIQLSLAAYDDGAFGGDYEPYTVYPGMNVRVDSHEFVVISH